MEDKLNDEGERRLNVSGVLRVLGVSRNGYYSFRKRLPSDRQKRKEAIMEKIIAIYNESHQNYAGEAYFYTQSGAPLDRYTALDSNSIYTCNIGINNNFSFFSNDQSYLEKTTKHEVGHAFILKHPSSVSIPSVMQQGRPGSSGAASYEVTDGDRANMEVKWG